MNILDSLAATVKELKVANVGFALVGGLAVSVRTEPRFTRDADLAVAVANDREAENIIRGLLISGFKVAASLEQEVTGRLATVRLIALTPDDDGAIIDILFASSGIENEVVEAATPEEIAPGLNLPVARTAHLIAMKVLSERPSRPQDSSDLIVLIRSATAEEIEIAREALELMSERGTSRDKDLKATLDRYVELAKTSDR